MYLKLSLLAVSCLIQLLIIKCIPNSIVSGKYKIYFNVPTYMCEQYGINFSDVFRKLEGMQYLLGPSEHVKIKTFHNPEVLGQRRPEKMDNISYTYNQRLDVLKKVNETFDGVGILNYTVWQPIFRQNQGRLKYFYDKGLEEEYDLYPLLDEKQSIELATMRFEFSSRTVLSRTIADIQEFLPLATWGLFDYPKCNSLSTDNFRTECDKEVIADNDKLFWLWDMRIALCPYIALPAHLTRELKRNYVNARLNEAKRIADKYQPTLEIFPYFSLKYQDDSDNLISFVELFIFLQQILKSGIIDGVIILATESDLNSEEKCHNYEHYFENELVPFMEGFFNL